ncbi:MAG TPA: RNA polymerase sigma factor [Planctomycetota bacterium]|nr:RNA polymerase sigma factor [Planctomycetota bacterium]
MGGSPALIGSNPRSGSRTREASKDPRELELLELAKKGDKDAYGKLFEGYADRIRRMATLVLPPHFSPEDVVQETFVRGMTRLESYRGEGDLCSWLVTIAINICRHLVRSPKRKMELTCQESLDREHHYGRVRSRGVVTKAVQKEDNRLLRIAMGYLTEAQREVFVLHYQDGLAYEDIGRILDMRAGAARALAHRAKATLRDRLGVSTPIPPDAD